MKKIKILVATFIVAAMGAFVLVPAATAGAIDPLAGACADNSDSAVCKDGARDPDSANKLIGTIVNVLLFLVGTLSVIMIIVSGIWYVTSNGDATKVTRAKNTLTYAIVGLLVALLAFAIVNWVLKLFK